MNKNLRVDQSYKYIDVEYCDEVSTCCENCGTPIKNLYTIEGSRDIKKYVVGSECVEKLIIINPSDFLESKRKHAKYLRFLRVLKKDVNFICYDTEYDSFWCYKTKKAYEWSKCAGALYRAPITPDLIDILKTKEFTFDYNI